MHYAGDTLELTGDVEALDAGELLAISAHRTDDVGGDSARLCVAVEDGLDSLIPSDPDEHVDRLERIGDDHHLVLGTDDRVYCYDLRQLEHD